MLWIMGDRKKYKPRNTNNVWKRNGFPYNFLVDVVDVIDVHHRSKSSCSLCVCIFIIKGHLAINVFNFAFSILSLCGFFFAFLAFIF